MSMLRPARQNSADFGLALSGPSLRIGASSCMRIPLEAVGKDAEKLAHRLVHGAEIGIIQLGINEPFGNAVRIAPGRHQLGTDCLDIGGNRLSERTPEAVIGGGQRLAARAEQDEFERAESLQADTFFP